MLPPRSLNETCLACKAPMPAEHTNCSECGANRDLELEAEMVAGPALASARKWILAIGVLYLVGLALTLIRYGEFLPEAFKVRLIAIHCGLFLAHLGLYWWAKTKPLAAASVALGLFIALQVTETLIDGSSIRSGIIVKIIFLVVLVRAVMAGKKAREIRSAAIPQARTT